MSIIEYGWPWSAAILLSDSFESGLSLLKDHWEALEQLEKDALADVAADKFRRSLVWPEWSWVSNLLSDLRDRDWAKIPPDRSPGEPNIKKYVFCALALRNHAQTERIQICSVSEFAGIVEVDADMFVSHLQRNLAEAREPELMVIISLKF